MNPIHTRQRQRRASRFILHPSSFILLLLLALILPLRPAGASLSTGSISGDQRGSASGQSSSRWQAFSATNAGPGPRSDHIAVVDPVRQKLVIFGGRAAAPLGDTWIFDWSTRAWREHKGTGPASRFGHGAVYDAANRRVLVVMGQGAGTDFFNDVWAFDLERERWSRLKNNATGAGSPRIRYGQSAALDRRGRLIISHGFSDRGRFDDTWAFEPAAARWVELTPDSGPRPLKRCLHELIYDAPADRLILFGGCSSGFGPCPQGDLWAFDLGRNRWTELKPTGATPAPRSNPSMVYDAANRRILLFGGLTAAGASAETWSYNLAGNRWIKHATAAGLAPRSSQALSYDARTRRVVLFGGRAKAGARNDLWIWQ